MNHVSAMGCHRALNALDLNAAMAARHAASNTRLLSSLRIAAKAAARRRIEGLRDLRQRIGADGYTLP